MNDFISSRILCPCMFELSDGVDDWSAVVQRCWHPAFEHIEPPFRIDFSFKGVGHEEEEDGCLTWVAVKRGICEAEGIVRIEAVKDAAQACTSPRERLETHKCMKTIAKALFQSPSIQETEPNVFYEEGRELWYNLDSMTWTNGRLVILFVHM
jgi:hypothetical protein